MQFVVLGAYLHQITLEIMLLLVNNLHENASQEVKTEEILKVLDCAIHNLHLTYNIALVLHEECT